MPMNVSSSGPCNKANIFLGLVDYISVHIRFNLERYLLNIMFFFFSKKLYLKTDIAAINSLSSSE